MKLTQKASVGNIFLNYFICCFDRGIIEKWLHAEDKVYLTDDAKVPLNIPDWNISMQIKRPTTNPVVSGQITDTATLIYTLTPIQDADDLVGEFTVSLTASQTANLQTNDIFDIEVSLGGDAIVWTVAQGKIIVLEDVTA